MRLKIWRALGRAVWPLRSARRRRVDRRIYLIAAGVVVLVFAVYLWAPSFLKTVENKLYDLHFVLRGPHYPGHQVAIVAIDESSLYALRRCPLPCSVCALAVLSLAGS